MRYGSDHKEFKQTTAYLLALLGGLRVFFVFVVALLLDGLFIRGLSRVDVRFSSPLVGMILDHIQLERIV